MRISTTRLPDYCWLWASFLLPNLVVAQAELIDIREPIQLWTFAKWVWLGSGLLVVLLLALLTWYLRKRRTPPSTSQPLIRNIFQQARDTLKELEQASSTLSAELFSVRASGILRLFIEDALHLPATERTTEEFLREFQDSGLNEPARAPLSSFLEQCDIVKFARQELPPSDRIELIALANKFITAVEAHQRPPTEATGTTGATGVSVTSTE